MACCHCIPTWKPSVLIFIPIQANKFIFVVAIVGGSIQCPFYVDDASVKLSDGIIESGMMEPNMMEPVDGTDAIHFERANGDDLGENQELLNDRCV